MEQKRSPEKFPIWGSTVPFNTGKSKLEVLRVSEKSMPLLGLQLFQDIFGTRIAKNRAALDNGTYQKSIRTGQERATFSDVPTLTSFVVPGSKATVILVPGGGFCYKEKQSEGSDKARDLNARGVSAFVLDYRVNPYRAPAAWMDLQRAVRYLRFHASELGISGNKIGTIGFSAGGYVVGAESLLLKDVPPAVEGYTPDEIDRLSGKPDFMGLIYPVTGFYRNPSMLCLQAGDSFFDAAKRPDLQKQYSLQWHLQTDMPPQFMAYGDKDPLKDMLDYAAAVEEAGLPLKKIVIPGASHGFLFVRDGHRIWMDAFVPWLERQVSE